MVLERLLLLWCPGLSVEGPTGEEARGFAAVLETVALRCPFVTPLRLGMASLPARAPSRYFGGEPEVLALLSEDLAPLLAETSVELHLGIADGLFAAVQAARRDLIVPAGDSRGFLAPLSVATLRRPELASICQRLGLSTLGSFAALDGGRVFERFGTEGAHCHRVARGEEGELVGIRDPSITVRLRSLDEPPPPVTQPSFFGGTSLADERAARAAIRLQRRLGPGEVRVARLAEGHDPAERAALVPYGSSETMTVAGLGAPWPGRLPAPSPSSVLSRPTKVRLTDPAGTSVEVTGRGLLTAVPGRCRIANEGPELEIVAWAGPWPLATRWWDLRRWRARLQVLSSSGVGLLLTAERGEWWLEGRYD